MSSMFAILDGIKYYGFNIALFGVDLLLLIIVILVNKLILGKKISIKWTLISVLLTLIIIASGIALFMKQISKIDIVHLIVIMILNILQNMIIHQIIKLLLKLNIMKVIMIII